MRFKINDIDNEYFYQIPKSLYTKRYKGLNSDAKIIYALLKDRMKLSRKNGWHDENGDIFLVFKQSEIGEMLDVSVSTVSRAMDQLEDYRLIDRVRPGMHRPNKIYINKTDVDSENIEDVTYTAGKEPIPSKGTAALSSAPTTDLHQRKSRLAPMQIKTCTSAT